MRLIDADALKKEIKQDIADDGLTERYVFYRINEAPTIEIIRCRECKYASHWQTLGICAVTKQRIKADDFCSYGERKVSEIPTGSERSSE